MGPFSGTCIANHAEFPARDAIAAAPQKVPCCSLSSSGDVLVVTSVLQTNVGRQDFSNQFSIDSELDLCLLASKIHTTPSVSLLP